MFMLEELVNIEYCKSMNFQFQGKIKFLLVCQFTEKSLCYQFVKYIEIDGAK